MVLIGFFTLAEASRVANSFSVFYSQLLHVFDWGRAGGASVYSVNMMVVALRSLLMGWLLDRFGPRWLYTSAALVIGVAFFTCSRLQPLGEFVVYDGGLGALGQTVLLSMTAVVAR